MPEITFIIPTYNANKQLKSCLRSIRCQKYPQNKIEIIIADGGSTDNTLEIAKEFGCRIIQNPRRLAEYGVQVGVRNSIGIFLVIFAADNELVGVNWIQKVIDVFKNNVDISAVWGRLASGENDLALNKYYALIQSDPLNWFMNKNLTSYLKSATRYKDCFIFNVDPKKPLVWGANGLVYRAEKIKKIWEQEGYLGDNDAFQYMIEQGNNIVAYFESPFVYHHHVRNLMDWISKWKRNFNQHLLDNIHTRNMNWIFTKNFKIRLSLWIIYSLIPVFSLFDSLKNIIIERNIYWLYHPFVSFTQTAIYISIIIFLGKRKRIFSLRLTK